jgi:flagellar hook-basal body complex protein FliE
MTIDPTSLAASLQGSMLEKIRESTGVGAGAGAGAVDGGSLKDTFVSALEEARTRESTSVQMAERFAQGDPDVGIHEVMIASEEANISLRFATTLKNKAIEAYRELMNTQV